MLELFHPFDIILTEKNIHSQARSQANVPIMQTPRAPMKHVSWSGRWLTSDEKKNLGQGPPPPFWFWQHVSTGKISSELHSWNTVPERPPIVCCHPPELCLIQGCRTTVPRNVPALHVSIDQPLNVRPRFLYSCCWMISKDLGIRASGEETLATRSTSLVPDSCWPLCWWIWQAKPWPTSARLQDTLGARLLKLGLQVCRALDKCPSAKVVWKSGLCAQLITSFVMSSSRPKYNAIIICAELIKTSCLHSLSTPVRSVLHVVHPDQGHTKQAVKLQQYHQWKDNDECYEQTEQTLEKNTRDVVNPRSRLLRAVLSSCLAEVGSRFNAFKADYSKSQGCVFFSRLTKVFFTCSQETLMRFISEIIPFLPPPWHESFLTAMHR